MLWCKIVLKLYNVAKKEIKFRIDSFINYLKIWLFKLKWGVDGE